MRRISLLLLTVALLAVAPLAHAKHKGKDKDKECCDEKYCPRKHDTSAAFDMLKSLEGTWKGSYYEESGKKEKMVVRYRVTSGGTAVEETMSPGKEKEMVSIYTLLNGKVQMVHYCMIGNQPHLAEQSFKNNTLVLKYVPTPGINAKKDMYMGNLTMTLKDPKHLTEAWVGYQNGKPIHTGETTFVKK